MIKEDGELEFSIIRVVVFRKENVDLMVFPNPFDKEITIRFESTKNDNLHLNMFNSIGQQVYESVYRINKGNNNLDLNIQGDLSKGAYIMRIQADNYTTFKKIIKR